MTKLDISNADFLVTSLIDRCPNTMMLRELVMNAIEAAVQAKEKKVIIGATEIDGFTKLRIWNTGPGMSARELRDACDISSSIRKAQSLDDNFGMGAKVASLSANKYGIRYRSCKDGHVSEVVLRESTDEKGKSIYERTDYSDENETGTPFQDVADVTSIADKDGEDLSFDWTEVVLCGDKQEQNTVKDPFNMNPKVSGRWIPNALYERFFYLPDDLIIALEDTVQAKGQQRKFQTIPERMKITANLHPKNVQYETVDAGGDIKIHYYFDGPNLKDKEKHNLSHAGNMASTPHFCGVIYKNEIYDFRKTWNWYATAPKFNIPFGAKHIYVAVELPDDANVFPEGYREELRWHNDSEKEKVIIENFGPQIRNCMPDWLKEKISQMRPKTVTSDDIKKELRKLLDDLQVETKGHVSGNGGGGTVPNHNSRRINSGKNESSERPSSTKNKKGPQTNIGGHLKYTPDIPNLIVVEQEEQLDQHPALRGRAGLYYEDTNEAFVNMLYSAPLKMIEEIKRDYMNEGDPEEIERSTREEAIKYFQLKIGKSIVFALAKKSLKEWDDDAVAAALKPESLSLAADDYRSDMTEILKKMSRRFKSSAAA